MPIVVLPADTAARLKPRLLQLAERVPVKMFAAEDVVAGIGFTPAEMAECGATNGRAVVVAVEDLAVLEAEIPQMEGDLRNYFPVSNPKVVARLDPFAPGQK